MELVGIIVYIISVCICFKEVSKVQIRDFEGKGHIVSILLGIVGIIPLLNTITATSIVLSNLEMNKD